MPLRRITAPATIVFGHEVRGALHVLKEQLMVPSKTLKSIPEYTAEITKHLQSACSIFKDTLTARQVRMKNHYDQKVVTLNTAIKF